MYYHNKEVIDVVNIISTNHLTQMKKTRWLLNVLSLILGTRATNIKIILADNTVFFNNLKFTYEHGNCLVLPEIQWRYSNNNGIQRKKMEKIGHLLGIAEVSR